MTAGAGLLDHVGQRRWRDRGRGGRQHGMPESATRRRYRTRRRVGQWCVESSNRGGRRCQRRIRGRIGSINDRDGKERQATNRSSNQGFHPRNSRLRRKRTGYGNVNVYLSYAHIVESAAIFNTLALNFVRGHIRGTLGATLPLFHLEDSPCAPAGCCRPLLWPSL